MDFEFLDLVVERSEDEIARGQRKAMLHDARYIYWQKEAKKERIDHEEYNKLSQFLKEHGRSVGSSYKTRRVEWSYDLVYKFDTETRRRQPAIYYSKIEQGTINYYIAYTEVDEEKLNSEERGAGGKGWKELDSLMRKQYSKGLEAIYGVLPVKDGKVWINECVKNVKQAIWFNNVVVNKILRNVYKADISSAYPTELCGSLPNANTAVMKEGRVAPTEEYPFAFYVKSGHVAEYGKFDTHELRKGKWYKQFELRNKINCMNRGETFRTFKEIEDFEEITILMKAADKTLNSAVNKMYWIKQNADSKATRDWYKWLINALIGFMRSEAHNTQHYQGHLAAIVYCRVVNRMIKLAEALEAEGNTPIYFAIDCIMWVGHESALTTREKQLGNFIEEVSGSEAAICGQGQYYIEKDVSGSTVQKHQGISKKIYNSYNIKSIKEFINKMGQATEFKEVFNPEINEFETVEVLRCQ